MVIQTWGTEFWGGTLLSLGFLNFTLAILTGAPLIVATAHFAMALMGGYMLAIIRQVPWDNFRTNLELQRIKRENRTIS
jgi:hypothetical protein